MRALRLLVTSLLCAAAALAAAEGTTRLFSLAPVQAKFFAEFATSREFVRPDPDLGFALVPGFTDGRYHINEQGFRGPPLPADLNERFTILCAGDSTTFGWRVGESEHFPAQLGRMLRERMADQIWVVNGGVPSFTSAQVLRKLSHDLAVIEPDVVVVTMPWNDTWYSSLSPWTPEALVPRLPDPLKMWLLRRSAFFRAMAQPVIRNPTVNSTAGEALAVFAANMGAVVDAVRRSGASPVFQTPPFDIDHVADDGLRFKPTGLNWEKDFAETVVRRYVERFEAVSRAKGVPVVQNPMSVEHTNKKDLFMDEIHPTGNGYAQTAAALLRALDEQGLVPPRGNTDR